MKKENSPAKELESLLNILTENKNIYIQWITRREVAAWAALAFYLLGIWSFLPFVLSYSKLVDVPTTIILFILVLITGMLFFRFIHSQYASIHYFNAYYLALERTIYRLFETENYESLDYSFDERDAFPQFIMEELNKRMEISQPFRGKLHPVRILWHLWADLFKKPKDKKLSNHARQEAAIYWLLIFGTFLPSFLYILLIFQKLPLKCQ